MFYSLPNKKRVRKMKQSENEIKAAIMKYLEANGYSVYRINNSGVAICGKGNKAGDKVRYAFHGKKGFPDLVAIKKGKNVVFVETKATGKNPSPEQAAFLEVAGSCPNTIAIWADNFDKFHYEFLTKTKGVYL